MDGAEPRWWGGALKSEGEALARWCFRSEAGQSPLVGRSTQERRGGICGGLKGGTQPQESGAHLMGRSPQFEAENPLGWVM
jgi:hypothetical protein